MELATLTGHLKHIADRLEVTEKLVVAALDGTELTRLARAVESVEKRLGENGWIIQEYSCCSKRRYLVKSL